MVVAPQQAWKLALAIVLIGAILLSAFAHAPRQPIAKRDLRQLVVSAIGLYGVGLFASVTHHGQLAGIIYAAGIVMCALAVWLSRGSEPGDGPDEPEDPLDEQPPPRPDGLTAYEWSEFERKFWDYSERSQRPREPA